MIIAGIGARATPSGIGTRMVIIGSWCRKNKIWVRSGHAKGADWAFECGAQEYCITYLPWYGYNADLKSKAKSHVFVVDAAAMALVEKYHPAAHKLSGSTRSLMARNCYQILGANLDSPVDAVICWTPDGKDVGGTSQAIRIARDYDIPILNMGLPQWDNSDKVIDWLDNKQFLLSQGVTDA